LLLLFYVSREEGAGSGREQPFYRPKARDPVVYGQRRPEEKAQGPVKSRRKLPMLETMQRFASCSHAPMRGWRGRRPAPGWWIDAGSGGAADVSATLRAHSSDPK